MSPKVLLSVSTGVMVACLTSGVLGASVVFEFLGLWKLMCPLGFWVPAWHLGFQVPGAFGRTGLSVGVVGRDKETRKAEYSWEKLSWL